MTKTGFVREYLYPLLHEIDSNIVSAEYVKATPSNEEYVNVYYATTNMQYMRIQICVTANSKQAIVTDVIKKLFY